MRLKWQEKKIEDEIVKKNSILKIITNKTNSNKNNKKNMTNKKIKWYFFKIIFYIC
jgi:hypothetical protein